jgi:NADP-dependent 3-hydroxy acid dehydrogenase YdfG
MYPAPNSCVVITGASRGIGAAAARLFRDKGMKVALIARPSDDLTALAQELGTIALPCDVADATQMQTAIKQAEAAFGPVAVLVNNAGVIDPISPLSQTDPQDFARAMNINLGGVFNGMRAVLPGMMARGRGTILTVGSGAAHNPVEGWSAYCATKAGAYMLTRMADLESRARGVRVLSLSPGTVATEMQRKIKTSGINPVSQLDWSVHIPAEWAALALWWMCGPGADSFLGAEVSLRDETIRRAVGAIA